MVLFIEILLIGVGLSMDAFAVSICKRSWNDKVQQETGSNDRVIF